MLETIIVIGVMAGIIAMQEWRVWWERKKAIRREQELLAAILAKDVNDYLQALDAVKREPGDHLREMELENELAINAQKLSQEEGIPV